MSLRHLCLALKNNGEGDAKSTRAGWCPQSKRKLLAAAAAGYPEFEVIFQDAAQDNADQVSDVENLLTQGIDLLIISPNEAAPLVAATRRKLHEDVACSFVDDRCAGVRPGVRRY